jgi:DNA-binding GntR family transcriptional regulator
VKLHAIVGSTVTLRKPFSTYDGAAACAVVLSCMQSHGKIRSGPGQVYARLRDMIVGGQLTAGTRIIELDFAARLGVSRTPLREALLLLQQEGFVVGTDGGQQSRLRVSPLTSEDAHDLYSLRGEIEGLAAERTAALPDSDRKLVVRQLRKLNSQLSKAAAARNLDTALLYDIDEGFHLYYVRAGATRRLLAAHDAIRPHIERYERLYMDRLARRLPVSVREHEVIVRAIANGDSDAAHLAVRANWRNAAERLGKVLESPVAEAQPA